MEIKQQTANQAPATPLPIGAITFDSDGQFRAAGCNLTNEDKHEVARRATAYGPLVDELKTIAAKYEKLWVEFGEKCGYTSQFMPIPVAEARALLRELGEDA